MFLAPFHHLSTNNTHYLAPRNSTSHHQIPHHPAGDLGGGVPGRGRSPRGGIIKSKISSTARQLIIYPRQLMKKCNDFRSNSIPNQRFYDPKISSRFQRISTIFEPILEDFIGPVRFSIIPILGSFRAIFKSLLAYLHLEGARIIRFTRS